MESTKDTTQMSGDASSAGNTGDTESFPRDQDGSSAAEISTLHHTESTKDTTQMSGDATSTGNTRDKELL